MLLQCGLMSRGREATGFVQAHCAPYVIAVTCVIAQVVSDSPTLLSLFAAQILEEAGGPEAYAAIKRKVPTYTSVRM